MKKLIKKVQLFGIISLIIMTVGCSNKNEDTSKNKDKGMQAEEAIKNKNVVEAFGSIKANDIKNIVVDFSTAIEKIHVKEGQQVKQGDVLVTLDMSGYRAELKGKEHRLNIVQSEKNKIQNTPVENDGNEIAIKKAESVVAFSEKLYIQEQNDFATKEDLFKSGAIPKSQLDEAKKVVDLRHKELESSKYDLESIKTNKKKKTDNKDDLKIKDSEIASEHHNISTLQDKLKRSYISNNNLVCDVPNGIIYEIGYQAGDFTDISKKLLSIINADSMVVEAEVAEEFIKDIKLGSEVKIIPLADKDKAYKGKVTQISHRAIQKNGDTIIPVEISIENNDGFLMPNFNVDAIIQTKKLN